MKNRVFSRNINRPGYDPPKFQSGGIILTYRDTILQNAVRGIKGTAMKLWPVPPAPLRWGAARVSGPTKPVRIFGTYYFVYDKRPAFAFASALDWLRRCRAAGLRLVLTSDISDSARWVTFALLRRLGYIPRNTNAIAPRAHQVYQEWLAKQRAA